jgi:plastocyanin
MSSYVKPNFLFVFFTLFILVLSVSSSPLSLSIYAFAQSDNSSDSGKEHGKGHDDGGSDDGGSDDGGSDDGGNSQSTVNSEVNSEPKNDEVNSNEQKNVSQVADQTVDDKYGSKVFYILIKSTNNETSFVPDKVTLTTGSTIVWLNQDNSEHRITMGAESNSKYALLNSLILPNGMVDQEFQSAGTYLYSDLDNPKSNGVITILDNSEKHAATSIALED